MALHEFDLIDRFFRDLTGTDDDVILGIGDDAAVLRQAPGQELVVSTDMLVSDVHFFSDADPADIGYKSLAVNLSDLAAMGAAPRWVTLALSLPEVDGDWLAGFSRGFAELAGVFGVRLVGGDITRGPLTITCQVLGVVPQGEAITRNGARAGDGIYVTGELGQAAAALELLRQPDHPSIPADCRQRLLRPLPRVRVGLQLRGIASAMIDISDGLAGDLEHILCASDAGAEVELDRLPVTAARSGDDRQTSLRLAVSGGDDYELCFTVPPAREGQLKRIAGEMECSLTRIGRIVSGTNIIWLLHGNQADSFDPESYRHF